MSERGRAGVVLPVVLFLLLALTAVAHGSLAVATGLGSLARARAARLQARLLAEGGIRGSGGLLAATPDDPPPPGETELHHPAPPRPGLSLRIRHHRLGLEWHLLEGEATAEMEGASATERLARIAWVLDPVARAGSVRGAVEHGGGVAVGPGAALDGSRFAEPPPGWTAAVCAPHQAAVDSLAAATTIRGAAPRGDELPSSGRGEPDPGPFDDVPGLGLLDAGRIADDPTARLVEGSPVTPGPVERMGTCDREASLNWGAPSTAGSPCASHLVVVADPGDLILEGGEGQGLLVVGGNLTLHDGARFTGIVLVGGSLALSGSSRLDGWVRIRGGAFLSGSAVVRASGCAVVRALAPSIVRPVPIFPPGGSWLEPL